MSRLDGYRVLPFPSESYYNDLQSSGGAMACRTPLAVGLLVCKLCAQDPSATLVGSVVDASGALVAGAKVEIRNTATNEIRKTESDDKGEFTALNLAPGLYDVSIFKSGFRTLRETNLELQVEQQARMEFHLELGSMMQTVEVQAVAPLINTEDAVRGDVVVSHQMVEIPLNGRELGGFAIPPPGVIPQRQAVTESPT